MQKVFIVNFNSLYEILGEIKENLFFKIVKLENEIDLINNSDLDIMDSLIISKNNHNLLLHKKITDKNILNLNDLPLVLTKLLQLINIKLIKLKFNHQSKININGYELNINSKVFTKNDLNLKDEFFKKLYKFNVQTKFIFNKSFFSIFDFFFNFFYICIIGVFCFLKCAHSIFSYINKSFWLGC